MTPRDQQQRRALRSALASRYYPWLVDPEIGPGTVEAGECDRCGAEARMVATCGPTSWASLGRRCAAVVGTSAWCDGHADEGVGWLRRLAALPAEADSIARLWWVATGEVRLDDEAVAPLIARALPSEGDR